MTAQICDDFFYNNENYILIDHESMIAELAVFTMDFPKTVFDIILNTACTKGYQANYTVEEGKLFARVGKETSSSPNFIFSNKEPIPYTGGCIIARFMRSPVAIYSRDSWSGYIDFEEAYELHFTNGQLDEERSLIEGILEAKKTENEPWYKSESTTPSMRWDLRHDIARKYLIYNYEHQAPLYEKEIEIIYSEV